MTNLEPDTIERPRLAAPGFRDLGILIAALVGATVLWVLATQVNGTDLSVKSGDSVREVGLTAVIVSTVLVTGLGLALLRWFVARTDQGPQGLRRWTILAGVVLVASLLGPATATGLSAGLALASLHLYVGLVVILAGRKVHGAR